MWTIRAKAARKLATTEEADGLLGEPELSLGRADQRLKELRAQPSEGLALLLEAFGLDDAVMECRLRAPRVRCGSLDEAQERHAEKLAPVDQLHRSFEQRAHALLASDLEDDEALLEAWVSVRRAYRSWANAINRRFYGLCVSRGALPDPSLRRRTVYEQVVHPLLEQGRRVAFILVDALRYELPQGFAPLVVVRSRDECFPLESRVLSNRRLHRCLVGK